MDHVKINEFFLYCVFVFHAFHVDIDKRDGLLGQRGIFRLF